MPLDTHIEIISGKDVALAIANSITVKEIWNNIYNLGGGENCRIIFKNFLNDLLEIIGIGRDYFPKEAFAEKGFNCGYISDNSKLQKKVKFQNDHLKYFYQKVKDWIGIKRYFVRTFRWFIKKYLLKCSKCYKKHRKNI